MKDNIFHIIICNSNYISMHKNKKKETAGLVRHKVYWTEAKITGLGPAVQRKIRALKWQQTYQVNFHCLRSSERAHMTENNGFYLVSLLPPGVP